MQSRLRSEGGGHSMLRRWSMSIISLSFSKSARWMVERCPCQELAGAGRQAEPRGSAIFWCPCSSISRRRRPSCLVHGSRAQHDRRAFPRVGCHTRAQTQGETVGVARRWNGSAGPETRTHRAEVSWQDERRGFPCEVETGRPDALPMRLPRRTQECHRCRVSK